jgi:tetratricopeptide (TPR) repeat protein
VVGANARLGYVFYLQGRYADAVREYERGLAFVSSSDHALKERTSIEIAMKLGAAYQRWGKPEEAARFFDRALKALRGEIDRALDMLERVHRALPALTAARIRRDPDLENLQGHPRFDALQRSAS